MSDERKREEASGATALARASGTAPVKLTPEEERQVARITSEVNRRVRRIGLEHESISEYLIDELFDGSWQRALVKEEKLGAPYLALKARAEKSLRLTPRELSAHVRIGAVGKLRASIDDDVWTGIDWSQKLELLPLLELDDGRKKFNEGVLFAARPNVGVLRLREWVQQAKPQLPGSVGRPRGATLTMAKGARFAETGIQLGNAKQRERFAEQLKEAPASERRALVRDLRKTHENLAALLELIDEA